MISDLDRFMEAMDVDALWVSGAIDHNPDMIYFTGIHHVGAADLFKQRGKDPVLFYSADFEREEAERSGLDARSYEQLWPIEGLLKELNGNLTAALAEQIKAALESIGVMRGRIAISGRTWINTSLAVVDALRQLLPQIEWMSFLKDTPIQKARMTKSPQEADRIRQMGSVTVEVVDRVANYLKSGRISQGVLVDAAGEAVTIGEVKRHIRLWIAELGAENPEETIFAQGRDAGIPHSTGNPQEVLTAGKPIIFDIFPCELGGGYFYDFTRTWCLGHAPDEVQSLYSEVKQVFDQIMQELQPGMPFRHYQNRTCEQFAQGGHITIAEKSNAIEGYIHSIGHGVGLNIHENPFSGITAAPEDILSPGMVFTVEPGLYYPSRGMGVRLEDTIYLNPSGEFEVLAQYPYDLVLPIKG
jgi:Xaa-Pro aminopeptidase